MQALSVVLILSWILDKTTQQSLMTTAGSPPSSNNQCVVCCYSNDNTLRLARMNSIMNTVNYVFGLKQQIDLAVVLKNSQGMTPSSLSKVLEFLRNLITYLEWKGLLIIHPDFARISIYSFADQATVKVNGISDSTAFYDACELNSTINSITRSSESSSSDPSIVLQWTLNTFEKSRRDAVKILFYFDNGGDWSPKTNISLTVAALLDMGVHRFAAGVGKPPDGWMHTAAREQNVQSVASDENMYYACMKEWTDALNAALTVTATNKYNNSRPVYSYNPVHNVNCQNTNCNDTNANSQCGCLSPTKLLCACDVYSKQYSCEVCSAVFDCATTATTNTTATTTHSTPITSDNTTSAKSDEDVSSKTWIIVIACGGGFCLLVILFIISVAVSLRKNCEKLSLAKLAELETNNGVYDMIDRYEIVLENPYDKINTPERDLENEYDYIKDNRNHENLLFAKLAELGTNNGVYDKINRNDPSVENPYNKMNTSERELENDYDYIKNDRNHENLQTAKVVELDTNNGVYEKIDRNEPEVENPYNKMNTEKQEFENKSLEELQPAKLAELGTINGLYDKIDKKKLVVDNSNNKISALQRDLENEYDYNKNNRSLEKLPSSKLAELGTINSEFNKIDRNEPVVENPNNKMSAKERDLENEYDHNKSNRNHENLQSAKVVELETDNGVYEKIDRNEPVAENLYNKMNTEEREFQKENHENLQSAKVVELETNNGVYEKIDRNEPVAENPYNKMNAEEREFQNESLVRLPSSKLAELGTIKGLYDKIDSNELVLENPNNKMSAKERDLENEYDHNKNNRNYENLQSAKVVEVDTNNGVYEKIDRNEPVAENPYNKMNAEEREFQNESLEKPPSVKLTELETNNDLYNKIDRNEQVVENLNNNMNTQEQELENESLEKPPSAKLVELGTNNDLYDKMDKNELVVVENRNNKMSAKTQVLENENHENLLTAKVVGLDTNNGVYEKIDRNEPEVENPYNKMNTEEREFENDLEKPPSVKLVELGTNDGLYDKIDSNEPEVENPNKMSAIERDLENEYDHNKNNRNLENLSSVKLAELGTNNGVYDKIDKNDLVVVEKPHNKMSTKERYLENEYDHYKNNRNLENLSSVKLAELGTNNGVYDKIDKNELVVVENLYNKMNAIERDLENEYDHYENNRQTLENLCDTSTILSSVSKSDLSGLPLKSEQESDKGGDNKSEDSVQHEDLPETFDDNTPN